MNVLIACEESQEVCKAFRKRGHNAFSCDIQPCSGGHPEWHIKGNCLFYLNPARMFDELDVPVWTHAFYTQDGKYHNLWGNWDLIIAHPPCTYLTTAATRAHSLKTYTREQIAERTRKRINAMEFFMSCIEADCPRFVVENPAGVMSACYRAPDQTIHPWYFVDSVYDPDYCTKRTQLWLKGVEPLKYELNVPDPLDNAERWQNGKKKIGLSNTMEAKQEARPLKALQRLWQSNGGEIVD